MLCACVIPYSKRVIGAVLLKNKLLKFVNFLTREVKFSKLRPKSPNLPLYHKTLHNFAHTILFLIW